MEYLQYSFGGSSFGGGSLFVLNLIINGIPSILYDLITLDVLITF